MNREYEAIVSIIQGDIENLENMLLGCVQFPTDALKAHLSAPAKRIRPILAFLFLKATNNEISEKQIQAQVAVELAHSASLIHDDIIDLADSRRGLPTLNNQYGDKIAVLAGDYILSVALKILVELKNETILTAFLETFSQMATGEISQYFLRNTIPTLKEYIQKSIQKTAGLFVVSLKSSAIFANEDIDLWCNFANNFGIAFQIKNDLDNVFFNKTDIKNGIYTAPVIFSGSTQITDEAICKTKTLINKYIYNAKKCLLKLPDNIYSRALDDILELYKYD